MHALFSRTSLVDQEFLDLVVPLYNSQCVELFGQLFQWSTVDADDIDDDKYQFGKKLSEVLSFLGNYLDRRFAVLPKEPERVDFKGFLRLLLMVVQSQSLIVSIPVLVTWTRLLSHRSLGQSIAELPDFVGPLLEVCASRLVRYESLAEDTQDPTFLFLMEDTDTIPERHAFLGNYRRYASTVIESIVQLKLADAVSHILTQTENILQNPYDGQPAFDPSTYEKNSPVVLRVDAQATVIEAALRGCMKWRGRTDVKSEDIGALEDRLEDWACRVLSMSFQVSRTHPSCTVCIILTIHRTLSCGNAFFNYWSSFPPRRSTENRALCSRFSPSTGSITMQLKISRQRACLNYKDSQQRCLIIFW
jgi:exportin-5